MKKLQAINGAQKTLLAAIRNVFNNIISSFEITYMCWENTCSINTIPYFLSTSSQERRYCCDKHKELCKSIDAVGMATF